MHDNAAHHRLRADLIARIAASGARPAVVLEAFDLDHAAALEAAQKDATADAERLADAGGLDRQSWRWPMHKPLVEAALAAELPVRAGNLSRRSLQRAVRAPSPAFADAPWAGRLRDAPWSTAQQAGLEATIVEGHCGKLPADVVPRIAQAQRERDAAMAQALGDAATRDGAILLAGNGHVRRDIGVPAYLAGKPFVSVGFIETDGDVRDDAVVRAELAAHPGYDYVWLTAKADRPDLCAKVPTGPGR
jgi:uncharacterized iron-regulated protein